MNEALKFEDVSDFCPDLVRSFCKFLDYNNVNFEDVFCLNFEITVESNRGEMEIRQLKSEQNYSSITKENRYFFLIMRFIIVYSFQMLKMFF